MYRVLCTLNSHESFYFLTKKATPGFVYKGGGSAEAVFVVPVFVFLWRWHGAPERGFVVAGVVVATWGKGIAAALEDARFFLDLAGVCGLFVCLPLLAGPAARADPLYPGKRVLAVGPQRSSRETEGGRLEGRFASPVTALLTLFSCTIGVSCITTALKEAGRQGI